MCVCVCVFVCVCVDRGTSMCPRSHLIPSTPITAYHPPAAAHGGAATGPGPGLGGWPGGRQSRACAAPPPPPAPHAPRRSSAVMFIFCGIVGSQSLGHYRHGPCSHTHPHPQTKTNTQSPQGAHTTHKPTWCTCPRRSVASWNGRGSVSCIGLLPSPPPPPPSPCPCPCPRCCASCAFCDGCCGGGSCACCVRCAVPRSRASDRKVKPCGCVTSFLATCYDKS